MTRLKGMAGGFRKEKEETALLGARLRYCELKMEQLMRQSRLQCVRNHVQLKMREIDIQLLLRCNILNYNPLRDDADGDADYTLWSRRVKDTLVHLGEQDRNTIALVQPTAPVSWRDFASVSAYCAGVTSHERKADTQGTRSKTRVARRTYPFLAAVIASCVPLGFSIVKLASSHSSFHDKSGGADSFAQRVYFVMALTALGSTYWHYQVFCDLQDCVKIYRNRKITQHKIALLHSQCEWMSEKDRLVATFNNPHATIKPLLDLGPISESMLSAIRCYHPTPH
jgi:hypothetical protein